MFHWPIPKDAVELKAISTLLFQMARAYVPISSKHVAYLTMGELQDIFLQIPFELWILPWPQLYFLSSCWNVVSWNMQMVIMGKRFAHWNKKMRANLESCLIKLALYLWDATLSDWWSPQRCFSSAWGSEDERSSHFLEGGSFASVKSVSMEKGLEKMPAVLTPGAMDCSLWRRAPSPPGTW